MRDKKQNCSPKGFTLLEVLVALILITIGISAAVAAISTGKFFLKQAEHKAQAMRVALVKMEEYLAKSYSDLEPGEPITGTAGKIKWQVNITQQYAEADHPNKKIPYKHLETIAFYDETDKAGNVYHKSLRLENIVPYPFVHTNSTNRDTIGSGGRRETLRIYGAPDHPVQYSSDPENFVGLHGANFVIGDPWDEKAQLRVKVTPEVPKYCLIIYNVAIQGLKPEDFANITDGDTIYTGCFVDGRGPKPIVTRTPIIGQPLISNVVALTSDEALQSGKEHTIEIRWCKDTPYGNITLAEGELIVVLVETPPIEVLVQGQTP